MDYQIELQELKEKSVDRLLCAEVYDKAAFLNLEAYLIKRTKNEIGKETISRQLLQVLHGAIGALESRAEYLPELKNEKEVITRFQAILGCLIAGEDPDSRQAGVPRII